MIHFPEPDTADANGLVAVGYHLHSHVLLSAYRRGIFPWYAEGQATLWWSPDPRMVLFPDEFHCSKRLQRRLRSDTYRRTWNQDFSAVIHACAAPRDTDDGETWILPEMITAYEALHDLSYAHSVEVWRGDLLVGGLYGVLVENVFFAESMFSRERDGSKMALAHLVARAKVESWSVIDVQFYTDHLASFGAREIPRREFLTHLQWR